MGLSVQREAPPAQRKQLGLYPIGFSAGDNYPLHLGPWMLGGFVPLFLGLGLILLHFLTQRISCALITLMKRSLIVFESFPT